MADGVHREDGVRALTAPMLAWPPRTRVAVAATATLAEVAWSAWSRRPWGDYFLQADAPHYLRIANGDTPHTMMPFASRQLGPLVAAGAAHALGWSVQAAFVREGFLFFAFTMAVVWAFQVASASPRWMLAAVFFLPYWPFLLESLAFPDMVYAALVAAMLWALAREKILLAALLLFPMMVARESTSLTLVCFLVAVWPRSGWRERATAVAATVAGSVVVGHLTRVTAGNAEHLSSGMYLLAKVPWNFLRNVLGVLPWTPSYSSFCAAPVWQMHVAVSRVRAIGICGVDHGAQVATLFDVLFGFGLMPLLAAMLWWRRRGLEGRSPLLRFVLVYGAAAFLLAPMLGAWFLHIAGYAWPLLGVGCSLMLGEGGVPAETGKKAWAWLGFLGAHLGVCGMFFYDQEFSRLWWALGLWVVGFGLLRVWLEPERS